jgi:hypothetical protein
LLTCPRRLFLLPPILKLNDESEFTWGAEQQEAFEKIKEYLSTPPVLRAPRRGVPFKLYIAAEDKIIEVVLTQEDEGKEYVIAYLGCRLLNPETRYAHIEKIMLITVLCLFQDETLSFV